MNKSPLLRRLLLAPPTLRTSLLPQFTSLNTRTTTRQYASPSILQPSFWASMIPKPLRRNPSSALTNANKSKKAAKKDWNPATFFIWIFLLIGSMSIQMIALRNEFAAFTRRADARIGLLREIVERVKKGEVVDVEGLLGKGGGKEKEWEELLQEIEEEDAALERSKSQRVQTIKPIEQLPTSKLAIQTSKPKDEQPKPKKTTSGFY
ncbi:hypothetical protein HYFRA_00012008 [Hymenoscyphus fraxineus]|uniref:Uncharacterized protein n=1 Tax=Hymenoscyphus fraxineus TaxID=746836 RepID=A0A9N9L3L7_9HELO|nr:hypothetical protein HYFRA_00012008 [Hymenoscyphus fraxineus]